jgi:glycosyltransferase involved in cell wall biosynthesis
MIRIAHVTFGLDVGGQEKLLVEFARHADREAFELHFVSLGSRGRLAGDIEACGWNVTALGAPDGLRPGLVFRLAAWMRRWRPQVVHVHDLRSLIYAGLATRLVGLRRPRLVYTRHWWQRDLSPRVAAAHRHFAGLVDRLVCVSELVREASEQEGLAPRRLQTIANGIDMVRFAYQGPCAGGPAVTVARLSPEKDLANLVRAVAIVAPRVPEQRFEVAGDGMYLNELKALAAELGVAERITFLGEVRDVPAVLARAGLFVLPSRAEGMPLTLLEAMARGLPVVATRVGGVPEVVAEGETGWLVPPADPEALAAAIERLATDPELARQFGAAGRRRAEECFDVRRMVAEYERMYRRLLGPRATWMAGTGQRS